MATTGVRPEPARLSPVRQRRFSVAEYHRMIEAGILGEDEHVELLEGEIVEMSPQNDPHMRVVVYLTRQFSRALSDDYEIRPQGPLTLRDSEPEPDLAIVRCADHPRGRHPATALLVVEVSDSSARRDLTVKSRIYARARIPEYWRVLVRSRRVEILSDPDPRRGIYRAVRTVTQGETLAPAFAPDLKLKVRAVFA